MSFQKILIAVDNSQHAMEAALKGFELADQVRGSVVVVSVADPAREIIPELALPLESNHEKAMKEANVILDDYASRFKNVQSVQRLDPMGPPKEEILKVAEDVGADLIVMGTHGRTGLLNLLLGSVAEYVIKHSKIPVMVVSLQTGSI